MSIDLIFLLLSGLFWIFLVIVQIKINPKWNLNRRSIRLITILLLICGFSLIFISLNSMFGPDNTYSSQD
jgi:glucan phosphoethanolaminetransferase (alkaline phosphatase superfamily)